MIIYDNRDKRRTHKYAYKIYWLERICEKCKTDKKICVHHKDHNPWNENRDNLQILCMSCHMKYHASNRTDETKKKMSEAQKGRKVFFSKEHRKKLSEAKKWVKFTKEHRENMRKARLWRKFPKK